MESTKNCAKTKKLRKVSLPSQKGLGLNRISVDELRENYKRQMSLPKDKDILPLYDPLLKAQDSILKTRKKTGVVFNKAFNEHHCLWDPTFPENPERLNCILRRCDELKLFTECIVFKPIVATKKYIQAQHTEDLFEKLKTTQQMSDANELEEFSSRYDSIYFHPETFKCALIAAGSVLEIVKAVLEEKIQNGMALVRPPGHHAMEDEFCGYCYFNNVALVAKFAIDEWKLKRILIVDWDVHHGQATQRLFYDDPRVLYFSTHRYQYGEYWPNLRESEYDFIGAGEGKGFNFNIPLNEIGMRNEDFLAYFHQVLLPVAYEYNPELILVSAGYDAALGCHEYSPEFVLISAGYDSALGDLKGRMKLSPSFYSHMTSMLMGLANGKVVAVLEGGYCPESLSESAMHTLRTLMGKPCPQLLDPIETPSLSMRESILNVIFVHKPFWKSLQYQESENSINWPLHTPIILCKHPPPVIGKFETRGSYINELYLENEKKILLKELLRLQEDTSLFECPNSLGLVYDEIMEKHVNLVEKNFPERPARTQEIMKKLGEFGILNRIHRIKSRIATIAEIELVHHQKLTKMIASLETLSMKERKQLEDNYDSIYFHEKTTEASLLAVGCLLQVVDFVCEKKCQSGLALIRPPGHHAEFNEPYGFCIFNNVAVAATYALSKYSLNRILIVDWDIHHGNGIQHIFESNPNVLYISLHLYKNGNFFPFSSDADSCNTGKGPGKGFNVNIPWNKSGMGDAEYIAAFTQIVLPIAYQFDPELVIVAAGFDAAVNDPLGGCCVTPECFGHMTNLLKTLANGHIILALEGGYNVASISYSVVMCAKSLLGDPLPLLKLNLTPNKSAIETIKQVINVQKEFWSSLCFQVSFPDPTFFLLKPSVQDKDEGIADDGTFHTPERTIIKKNSSPGESDSEFLTPPQTPEHLSTQTKTETSGLNDKDLENFLEDLKALNLDNHSKESILPVPLPLLDHSNKIPLCPQQFSKILTTTSLTNNSVNQLCDNLSSLNKTQVFHNERNHDSLNLKNINVEICRNNDNKILKENSQTQQVSNLQMAPKNETNTHTIKADEDPLEEELEGAVGGVDLSSQTNIGQLQMGQEEMYAVVPLENCPHLVEVMPIPSRGIDVFANCEDCQDPSENWVCLTCYKVLCGRYVREHMIEHSLCCDHHIVMSYADLSVWCYACESYVTNEILCQVKQAAHISKFGSSFSS